MKAGRSLQIFLLLPLVLVLVAALVVVYSALTSVRQQFGLVSAEQNGDLHVIEEAAGFSRDIGLIQKRMSVALEGTSAGSLTELQLYRMHTAIVNDLDALGQRVQHLAKSELVLDVNHGSAKGLKQEFESYRRFVVMSTDVIAVDPTVAKKLMDQAQQHFREFAIFSSRISALLAERSQKRNAVQTQSFAHVLDRVLWMGLVGLLLLFALTLWVARRSSRRMMDIADALSALTHSESKTIDLPQIEAMQRDVGGELGRIAGTLLAFRSALERQHQAEEEAYQLAFYDSLTQLPNRRMLVERIQRALKGCARHHERAAVMLIDMDGFKRINDARGYAVGDQILKEVGRRLSISVSENDTVARLGGDKFGILLVSLHARSQKAAGKVERVVSHITAGLAAPLTMNEQDYFLTASIGVALFDENLQSLDDPLRHAEAAMYQAKKDGRNTFRFYDPDIQAHLEARVGLETDLRQAVLRQELRLFYQTQVDEQDRVCGVEALVRWFHPERGMVSPAQFIPLAEESDLILPIGHWVLKTACRQLQTWATDPQRAGLSIAVNVSARQFRQRDFCQQVRAALAETGVQPQRLKLELTESLVLEDVEATIAKMLELRAQGVRFSMDDFGTGYSSLQYLKRLPLDQLKIEQSFVRDITTDPDDAAIVQTIIAMGRALRLEVIAEGVETREQQNFLREQGCCAYQGYFFSKPLPLEQLEAVLSASTVIEATAPLSRVEQQNALV
ncbi:MAG: EAL domain-containing protein [Burkholderiaceae bacterium]|nr:EAL domain-containing protein [Burkholderiaceae bacterium]